MFKAAKNISDNISQYISTFASEIDATKTYISLSALDSDIANKFLIYPGKIVYVFETKKFYYIDLEIDGQSTFDSTIKTLWLAKLNNILSNGVDIITSDYELEGYQNTWVYNEVFDAGIDIPNNTGYTPITNNGQLDWIQSEITLNTDISAQFDTTIFSMDYLPINGFTINTFVKGLENSTLCLYSSNINIIKGDNGPDSIEYGVLNKNGLDIEFSMFYNNSIEKWEFTAKKNLNSIVINSIILKTKIF